MPTQLNERKLYERRNVDDVFVRSVIGGLLALLNKRLSYDQVWNDEANDVETITVPFFYEFGGALSEKFIQDNFITFGDACGFKKINGNFDVMPHGRIALNQTQVEAENITNRAVLGEYQKIDPRDGKLKTWVSNLYSLPLSVTVSVEIRCNSFIEMLKIDQGCKEFFYKNKTYYTTYRGMKIPCRAGFPDSYLGDKISGYTMGTDHDKNYQTIKFEIAIETYQPVFDPTTERLATNRIKAFAKEVAVTCEDHLGKAEKGKWDENNEPITYVYRTKGYNVSDEKDSLDLNNIIYLIDDYKDMSLFPSGAAMKLRWDFRKEKGDMNSIIIRYEEGDPLNTKYEHFGRVNKKSTTIAVIDNHLEYTWNVPDDFTDFKGIDVVLFNSAKVTTYKNPEIKVVPDPSTKMITKDSFFVIDPGYFIVDSSEDQEREGHDIEAKIQGVINYETRDGRYEEIGFMLPVLNNEVKVVKDDSSKIAFDEGDFEDAKYKNDFTPRTIDIYIQDGNNEKIFCKIPNVTIV